MYDVVAVQISQAQCYTVSQCLHCLLWQVLSVPVLVNVVYQVSSRLELSGYEHFVLCFKRFDELHYVRVLAWS